MLAIFVPDGGAVGKQLFPSAVRERGVAERERQLAAALMRIAALEKRNAELQERNAALERLVEQPNRRAVTSSRQHGKQIRR